MIRQIQNRKRRAKRKTLNVVIHVGKLYSFYLKGPSYETGRGWHCVQWIDHSFLYYRVIFTPFFTAAKWLNLLKKLQTPVRSFIVTPPRKSNILRFYYTQRGSNVPVEDLIGISSAVWGALSVYVKCWRISSGKTRGIFRHCTLWDKDSSGKWVAADQSSLRVTCRKIGQNGGTLASVFLAFVIKLSNIMTKDTLKMFFKIYKYITSNITLCFLKYPK
jgi:hypothetical protein